MKSIDTQDDRTDAVPTETLPSLALLLDEVERQLERHGELGLLSVTVLRRDADGAAGSDTAGWQDYDSIQREIAVFLARFAERRMRRSDLLLDPVVAGNTFVLLVGPPREERDLDRYDVARVRHRLALELRGHLGSAVGDAHGRLHDVHVGGALMHDRPEIDRRRIIYRAFEEAFADGLGHRPQDGLRESVMLQEVLHSRLVTAVYQPLVDTIEQRIIGYEALTRVPADRFRSPEALFRAANDHGALWAVERLCRATAVDNLPRLEPDQLLFLNIEPDSFHDPHLCQEGFLRSLERAGLEPDRLVLELTEHSAVKDFGEMRRIVDEVRSTGYRLAMDDVGSGYAGLQAIAEIRPDYLKVDMTLVRGVHLDPIKRELISTIRRFTDSTGITLVAEGVETREELASLTHVGVRCAQGYLFARPDSSPDAPDWRSLGRQRRD